MVNNREHLIDIDLQLFATEFDDLIKELTDAGGYTPETPATTNPETPPVTPETPTTDPATPVTPETPATTTPDTTTPPVAPQGDDKKEFAFAQLRTQNKQLEQSLKAVAAALQITETDPAKVQEAINEKLINLQAKQTGIPAEFLKKLENSEREMSVWKEQKVEMDNTNALNALGVKYKMNQEDMTSFLAQLYSENTDPFKAEGMDFEYEYFKRNSAIIIQRNSEAAIKAEQERAALAAQGATPPAGASNPQSQTPGKVESMAQLDTFLDGLTIKK